MSQRLDLGIFFMSYFCLIILKLLITNTSLNTFFLMLFNFQILCNNLTMFLRLEWIKKSSNSSNENQLHCEKCFKIISEANLCRCLTLLCLQCIDTHLCQKNNELNKQETKKPSEAMSINEVGNKQGEIIQTHPRSLLNQRKEQSINRLNCQRCNIKQAIKHCLECKISYFCSYCFDQFHRTKKISMHKYEQIDMTKVKPIQFGERIYFSNIQSFNQSSISENKKLFCPTIPQKSIQTLNVNGFEKNQNDKMYKMQKINMMITNINFVKLQMEQQRKRIELRGEQTLNQIMKELDGIMMEIKDKKLQLQIYCRQQFKNQLKLYQQLSKMIAQSNTSIGNMKSLVDHSINYPYFQCMLSQKMQRQFEKVRKTTEQCQLQKVSDCNYQISDQLQSQSLQIKDILKRIDIKKIINQRIIQFQKPSINIIPCKSQKNSLMGDKLKNQLKKMKKSLHLTSCKSSDYINQLTHSMVLPTPKSKLGINKSQIIKKSKIESSNRSGNYDNINCSSEEEKYLKNSPSLKAHHLPKLVLKQSQIKVDSCHRKNMQIKKETDRGALKKIHKYSQNWRVNEMTMTPTHKAETANKFISSIRQYSNRSNIDIQIQHAFKQLQQEEENLHSSTLSFESFFIKGNNNKS